MTGRQDQAKRGNIAAIAAMLVLAGWVTTPVFAASDRDIQCDTGAEATLEIKTESMSTTVEAVADDHLLKPSVEATARQVFSDTTSETEMEEAVEAESDDDEAATPRLRPLSDNKLVPFRRQMYRRDI
jgi:type III secretory pathway component EscR